MNAQTDRKKQLKTFFSDSKHRTNTSWLHSVKMSMYFLYTISEDLSHFYFYIHFLADKPLLLLKQRKLVTLSICRFLSFHCLIVCFVYWELNFPF